jgi:hypothetical protein
MDWEKASPELGIYLQNLLIGYNCQKKPMFGSPVYFVNDNMFAGVKGVFSLGQARPGQHHG